MKKNCTFRFRAGYFTLCLTLLSTIFFATGNAQVTLVSWVGFASGPPVNATSYLPINNGKQLTNGGQSGLAAVTDAGTSTQAIFLVNGWSAGNYFQANFSATNYANNTITFLLGAFQFGAKNFKMQYAVGSSSTYIDFGTAMTFPSAGGETVFTQTLPAACNGQANVNIRITATSAGNGGGNYLDNVTVSGSAMTAPGITTQPSAVTTCEGSDATFTLVASNAISYQWEYRTSSSAAFTNVPNNATYDNETTAALTVNDVTAAMSGYEYRCIVTGGTTPNATSNTVALTVNAYGTWNGSVNSNWNNAANWNCGTVPTATTNVTISSGGNQPIVNIGTATCNNLTINSGATLSFAAGTNQLDIKGATTVTGSLNGTGGKVIFSGAATQTIPAGSYKDLEVNSNINKTLGGNITVSGVFTLTSGTVTLGTSNVTLTNTGNFSGSNASSFLVTNGTGLLTQQGLGSGARTGSINFPVGSSATSFTPLIINNNNGVADNFTVQVKDGVYSSYSGNTGTGALTGNSVNKTWFVSEAVAGGSNANIQLTWNQANELPGFDRDNCAISHYTGGAWQSGTITSALGVGPFTIARNGITSFSPFGIGSTGSPLPLELLAFTGKKVADGVQLTWKTTNEKSFRDFGIERSIDGSRYTQIGVAASQKLDEEALYSFIDPSGNIHTDVFYRLKINDEDGTSRYSTVVSVSNIGAGGMNIYPNPVANGTLYVKLADASMTDALLTITDLSGRSVKRETIAAGKIANGSISINVAMLPAGTYLLSVANANGALLHATFMVN